MKDAISPVSSVTSAVNDTSPVGRVELEVVSPESSGSAGDAVQFRAALDRHMNKTAGEDAIPPVGGKDNNSLGQQIATRTAALASEMQKNQQHVSQMLEQASRTGDSMQLMKAMMALNDHEIRVQTITKTVSKASSSIEQLTKLQ
jgi:hypothetical protein